MAAGLGVCGYYMYTRYPFFGVNMPLWFGLSPVSSGMFGLPAGLLTIIVVSLLTPPPPAEVREFVDRLRSRFAGYGLLAFVLTLTVLLAASLVAFPWLGAAAVAAALYYYSVLSR